MKKLRKLVVASAFALATSASQAAVVDTWFFTVDMNWGTGRHHYGRHHYFHFG